MQVTKTCLKSLLRLCAEIGTHKHVCHVIDIKDLRHLRKRLVYSRPVALSGEPSNHHYHMECPEKYRRKLPHALSLCGLPTRGERDFSRKCRGRSELNTAIRFPTCTKQVTLLLKLLSTASYIETYSNHQQHPSYFKSLKKNFFLVWDTVQVWGTRLLPSSLCAEMWQRQQHLLGTKHEIGSFVQVQRRGYAPLYGGNTWSSLAAWGYLPRMDSRLVTGSCTLYMQVCG